MSEQFKVFFAANWFTMFFIALSIVAIGIYFSQESSIGDCLG